MSDQSASSSFCLTLSLLTAGSESQDTLCPWKMCYKEAGQIQDIIRAMLFNQQKKGNLIQIFPPRLGGRMMSTEESVLPITFLLRKLQWGAWL